MTVTVVEGMLVYDIPFENLSPSLINMQSILAKDGHYQATSCNRLHSSINIFLEWYGPIYKHMKKGECNL